MSTFDEQTYLPFTLEDMLDSEFEFVRLLFGDWDWIKEKYGDDSVDGYYLNGHAVQGLIIAARFDAGLVPQPDSINYTSEGDYCVIDFDNMEDATATARLASDLLNNPEELRRIIQVARQHDFAD